MGNYLEAARERAMTMQEVILRAMSGKIGWLDAADILRIRPRTMRRWKRRYEILGYDGLYDRRRQIPSPRRVPMAQAEQVLKLYQEEYLGWNVKHFHERLEEEHGIGLSYTWVKMALQGAGLVPKDRRRTPHRKRRERRPVPGMLQHIDGSRHRWLEGQELDLNLVMDDATNEVYWASPGRSESERRRVSATRAVFAGVAPSRRQRLASAPVKPLRSRPGGHWTSVPSARCAQAYGDDRGRWCEKTSSTRREWDQHSSSPESPRCAVVGRRETGSWPASVSAASGC